MNGPQVQRLRAAVGPAEHQLLITAQAEWAEGAALLGAVARALEGAAPNIQDQIGETGKAASDAFRTVSSKVNERSKQMGAASTALLNAAQALKAAQDARDYIDSHPVIDPGPRPVFTPGVEMDHDDINQMKAWNARSSQAEGQAGDHETRARIAADHMDEVYSASSVEMKKVHGVPDDRKPIEDPGSGGGGSAGGAPPSGGSAPPAGGGGNGSTTTTTRPPDSTTTVTWDPHDSTTNDGGGTGDDGGSTTTVDPWLPPGSEQGGTPTGPSTIGNAPGGGSTSTGSSGGLGAPAGVVGALGGGIMGGMTGITGAVRGPTVVPAGGAAGTSGRAIGSSSRAGGATGSALGRGTSAATAGSPTGTRGTRGGAAGGARGAGGGSGAAGRSGARGAAGSRGSAVGGQGAGRSKKDPRKKGSAIFDEEQDWIDDEGAAPGVID